MVSDPNDYAVTCRAIASHVDVGPISGLGHISTFVRISLYYSQVMLTRATGAHIVFSQVMDPA